MWKRLGQPLSAKQMVGVVAAISVAAGVIIGLYYGAAAWWHQKVVGRSIPDALAGIRTQRDALAVVIESYKNQFGYYPPLLTSAGSNRGVINPLCYELLGARFDAKTSEFHIPVTKDGVSVAEVRRYFSMNSFSNCLPFPTLPTNFLANRPLAVAPLTTDADLFGIAVNFTEFTPESCWGDFAFTPWRYATNPAEHNPGKFDLWVEVTVAGKHFTIGNWPEAK